MQDRECSDCRDTTLISLRWVAILLVYFTFGLNGFCRVFDNEIHGAYVFLLGWVAASSAVLFCAVDARTLGKTVASCITCISLLHGRWQCPSTSSGRVEGKASAWQSDIQSAC